MRTKTYDLCISPGNSKLGPVANWSLEPGRTCPMKCDGCYAMKGRHLWQTVVSAREDNTEFVFGCESRGDYYPLVTEVNEFIRSNDFQGDMFRVHEAGDFYSVMYAQAWYQIAKENPDVRFCAFTKAFDVVRHVPFHELPNFSLLLSAWPGFDLPEDLMKYYRIAWMKDKAGVEDRIPSRSFPCPGSTRTCFNCGYCWKTTGRTFDIVLNEH